jgi:hypothetical protein
MYIRGRSRSIICFRCERLFPRPIGLLRRLSANSRFVRRPRNTYTCLSLDRHITQPFPLLYRMCQHACPVHFAYSFRPMHRQLCLLRHMATSSHTHPLSEGPEMPSLDPSEPSRGAVSSPLARRRVLSADPLPPSSCVRVQNCAPAAESGLRAPRRRETKGPLSAYLHHPVEHRSSKQSRDILGMSWARYPVTDSLRDHCAFKHWMLSICTSLVNHSMTGLHYSDQDYPLRPFYWPTSQD